MAGTALQPATRGFAVNYTGSDVSACVEVLAAPGAGVSHYLKKVLINVQAEIDVTIGEGKTATAVTSTILGSLGMSANSTIVYEFVTPIKLAANTALTLDASGAGILTVFVEGYTE